MRSNRNFRRLWLAQLISEIGDWFYSLAVYDLLFELVPRMGTGTSDGHAQHQYGAGQAVGVAIILQLLPWFFMTPIAGALADRFPRRRLMIAADVAQGFIVLGLLWVREPSQVWLIYLLLGLEVIFASIFEPAHSALLPALVSEDELLPANALASATWSVALTVGAAAGGAVTALAGRDVAFVLNSLSFFASALLTKGIRVKETHVEGRQSAAPISQESSPAWTDSLKEGWSYLRASPRVGLLVLAKTGLGCFGGALLLLAVFGEQVFPLAGHGAAAMGLLYSARGLGAGIGPLIGDHLTGGRERKMWASISTSFFVMGLAYIAFSRAPNLLLAALCVFLGHMGGSNIWVMSSTLLQLNVSDRFRGRVFALDFGLNMLTASASNYVVGRGLDVWGLSPRALARALGAVLLLPGLLWIPAQARWAPKAGEHARS